jgi:hypothetical protein
MVPSDDVIAVEQRLAALKVALGRQPTDTLHFVNLKKHGQRVKAAQELGNLESVTLASVIVCKNHLPATPVLTDDQAYLYAVRLLLERISWFSRDRGAVADFTLAHIVRFRMQQLRDYENRLRGHSECKIKWNHLDPRGGRIDQPQRVPLLQVADLAASGTAQAFEPDEFGNTEDRGL